MGSTKAASNRFGFLGRVLLGLLNALKKAFRLSVLDSLKSVRKISGSVYKKMFLIFSSLFSSLLFCTCLVYFSLYDDPLYWGFSTKSFSLVKVSNLSNLSKNSFIVLEMKANDKIANVYTS